MLPLNLNCSNCKLKNKYDAEYCKNCNNKLMEDNDIETSVLKQNINSKSLLVGIILILISSSLYITEFNNREDELLSWGLTVLASSLGLIVYYILFNFLSNFNNSHKVVEEIKMFRKGD